MLYEVYSSQQWWFHGRMRGLALAENTAVAMEILFVCEAVTVVHLFYFESLPSNRSKCHIIFGRFPLGPQYEMINKTLKFVYIGNKFCETVDSRKYIRRVTNVTSATILNKNCNLLNSHPMMQVISVLRINIQTSWSHFRTPITKVPYFAPRSRHGSARLRRTLADQRGNLKSRKPDEGH
jgi:hypothetical protein